ncbi:MAG: hypothetical protein K6G28_02275 [Acholeplasmatales bacterium]|nr:hypothetical protein [Acholeplasmatales bacterium]
MNTYICIDLKSFYASVECVLRGLDPLTTNLVVADVSRTEKTICLAVSPSLKSYKIPSRARLFEVVQAVKEINRKRKIANSNRNFRAKSYNNLSLIADKTLELDYIAATPQMSKYIEFSSRIYQIYLKYIDASDIHVYSIDEVFMDITHYLSLYKKTAEELVRQIIKEIYETTGITATGGIGTNMYLAKIAMDIEAKKKEADKYGVRIAYLNEELYKKNLWNHTPITDFWRIGKGISNRLEKYGIYTMGDIARCAISNEELLFKEFGVNAEILIDHAFGIEPVTIQDIKAYKPQNTSLTVGQVIHCAYEKEKALLVVKEMTYELYEQMLEKHILTDQISISIGYDIEQHFEYVGEYQEDMYGRKMPKSVHGSINLKDYTNSFELLKEASTTLFNRLCDDNLLVRRLFIVATHTLDEANYKPKEVRLTLFDDPKEILKNAEEQHVKEKKERSVEKTILELKKRFGKNAVVKGLDLEEGGTTIDRNNQIGGHKA